VLGKDEAAAQGATGKALAMVREKWEPETTARNLRLMREVRTVRDESYAWAEQLEQVLLAKAKS